MIQSLNEFAKLWLLRNEERTGFLCSFDAMK